MKKIIAIAPLLFFASLLQAQQWLGSTDSNNKIYRGDKIKVGYGPLYLDWTYQNNWGGGASNWAGYVGFNAYRNNNDTKDWFYGENPYTNKGVFEGSNDGFRWLYRTTVNNDGAGQHQLGELMRLTNGGYVGIGTNNPQSMLDIQADVGRSGLRVQGGQPYGTYYMDVTPFLQSSPWSVGYAFNLKSSNGSWNSVMSLIDGKVGLGTNTPEQKLDVRGNLVLEAGTSPSIYTGTGTNDLGRYLQLLNSYQGPAASGLKAGGILISDSYSYANPGKNDLIVKGSVSIGTATLDANAKLAVKGQIHANEVKVDLNVQGPDYVFEKDYKLSSLEEIKNYIEHNKHLPEIPSAKEMEKNGVQLGEMNMLLLKKIEELTLHVIELKKEINTLKSK